ncbi:hypothetical protein GCM10012289_04130 [Nonomuraea cavernae]|uniref:Uncharacterized protein n=1 Tax=Nonomuraea cavernae TaxID=2045107 RepID=A0A917YRP3_9ACTN|nr:hypothetical protein GCM10012289_04130 [Nonomuraea cavernae]
MRISWICLAIYAILSRSIVSFAEAKHIPEKARRQFNATGIRLTRRSVVVLDLILGVWASPGAVRADQLHNAKDEGAGDDHRGDER